MSSIPKVIKVTAIGIFLLLISFLAHSQVKVADAKVLNPVNASMGINGSEIIAFAEKYLGTPYRYASSDPKKGFDCSGFVHYIFSHFNISLPRSSREYKTLGQTLKPEEFKVGDVIVFYGFRDKSHIGHVGIISEANGMKSKFIHASSGKAHSVIISDLDSEGYRSRFYRCISRVP